MNAIAKAVFYGVGGMIRKVDKVVAKHESTEDFLEAVRILSHAKEHLCDRVMDAGDVQAWFTVDDALKSLL